MDIILAHRQIDFDALASMVAAQKIYPNSVLVMDGKPNAFVQDFLALSRDLLRFYRAQDINMDEVTRVILVDTHDLHRAGVLGDKVAKHPDVEIEIYDHHPYAGELKQGMAIEPVGACATLLVEKLAGLGIPLSGFEATLIAIGIYDDTGSLLFDNTTVRDVHAVAYLLEQGANLGVIAKNLRRPLAEEQKELLQELLDQGQTEFFDGLPVYISFAETKDYVGGLALLAHRVGELEGADTWFLLVKMENRVYIVGRSRGRGLPINGIVQMFGGAGHERAASATIKDAELSDILKKLRSAIQSHAKRPHLVRDIMSFPVKTVTPETRLGDVEQILLRYGHTGVPVTEGHNLVGIISRRDVDKAIKHGLKHAPVKGFMAAKVATVDADAPWDEVQRLMVQHDIGRLPVVEDGNLVGIVSRSDVLRLVHGGSVPIETQLVRERSAAIRQDILDLIAHLPEEVQKVLEAVRDTAEEEQCSVYVVGGFVRDLLLSVPTQDLDFVVEGSGGQFAQALMKRMPNGKLTQHITFGTAQIIFPDGSHLDIASTRWEHYSFPGALPQVEESCLRDDLFRRDFTINSMAICLNTDRFGELVDYYGGKQDLQQGKIRFLHNISFIDDPTRMIRAIRFAERYYFSFAKETLDALYTAIETGVLGKLSVERFSEEMLLILKENNYLAMGQTLVKCGLLNAWFGKELAWNFNLDDAEESVNWSLNIRWLSSVSRMDSAEIESLLERVCLNKSLRDETIHYIHLRESLKESLSLSEMDRLLTKAPKEVVFVLARDESYKHKISECLKAAQRINMSLDGKALIKMGVKQGPEIGKILDRVRMAWLEGKISTTEEEQLMARKWVKAQR
ncbi:tRNA nucleotidyltransferase/poly(A) polymerase [Desulfosporosinus orientis DSM 765]|uniref:tRNA nucleotidyltransferase/poly(A) polymerase n=1 Tax=Desulfosporosinus orientis (strain ATCC 19365 / DSM 765 / NCIMB 8382 / VKM B-1628 / Singapore I) TaxID=768706 RepID=G7WAJ2_DESOD|nr:CBS domain-containing protein [Desulfosporosinus orientis]AET66760.1 tRNA nucleotidyltransferase/poly(A) polymerase [Desulfosporosinus orientis DSM 765]